MKEISLPSGKKLSIGSTPFSESKALFQAVLEELRKIGISSKDDHMEVMKNLFCMGFSSKKVEDALAVCLKRCLYDGLKIDENTFEPEESRADYLPVCLEVVKENVAPFLKGLSAGLNSVSTLITNSLK